MDDFGYDLSLTVDEIRPRYSWNGLDGASDGGTCHGSVPEAITCALQAESYEDAIRNAISIGGDSDTIGCITGGIAEALYGIPSDIRTHALHLELMRVLVHPGRLCHDCVLHVAALFLLAVESHISFEAYKCL